MPPVVTGQEGLSTVDVRKLPPAPGQRVTYPSGPFALCLLHKKFGSVTPASAKYKLVLYIGGYIQYGAFAIFNLVPKAFVVNLNRKFEHIIFKIAEITERSLQANLRFNRGGAWHPQINRQSGG